MSKTKRKLILNVMKERIDDIVDKTLADLDALDTPPSILLKGNTGTAKFSYGPKGLVSLTGLMKKFRIHVKHGFVDTTSVGDSNRVLESKGSNWKGKIRLRVNVKEHTNDKVSEYQLVQSLQNVICAHKFFRFTELRFYTENALYVGVCKIGKSEYIKHTGKYLIFDMTVLGESTLVEFRNHNE